MDAIHEANSIQEAGSLGGGGGGLPASPSWQRERTELLGEMALDQQERGRLLRELNAERARANEGATERERLFYQVEGLVSEVHQLETQVEAGESAERRSKRELSTGSAASPAAAGAAGAQGGGGSGGRAQRKREKEQVSKLKDDGNTAHKQGKYKEAVDAYTSALQLDPTSAVLFSNRSASCLALKEPERALQDAQMATTLNSSWARAHYRRGAALHALERWAEATSAYSKCLELNPDDTSARVNLDRVRAKATAIKSTRSCTLSESGVQSSEPAGLLLRADAAFAPVGGGAPLRHCDEVCMVTRMMS